VNSRIWLEQLGRDLSHAIRGLWRAPGLALTAIVAIAVLAPMRRASRTDPAEALRSE
jgi:hypothetical protein